MKFIVFDECFDVRCVFVAVGTWWVCKKFLLTAPKTDESLTCCVVFGGLSYISPTDKNLTRLKFFYCKESWISKSEDSFVKKPFVHDTNRWNFSRFLWLIKIYYSAKMMMTIWYDLTLILYNFSILISTFSFRLVVRTSRKFTLRLCLIFSLNHPLMYEILDWHWNPFPSRCFFVRSLARSFISPSLQILTSVFAAASDSPRIGNSEIKIPLLVAWQHFIAISVEDMRSWN